MKKIIYILFLFNFIISCQQEKQRIQVPVIFQGKIENAPAKKILLKGTNEKKIVEISLDSINNFIDTLYINEGYYKFLLGEQYTWLYLKPGNNLFMKLDYSLFDQSLKYEGEGAEINNYLAKKMLKGIDLRSLTSYNYYGKLDEDDFLKFTDDIYQQYDKLLIGLKDKKFLELEKFRNKILIIGLISKYPMIRAYLTKNPEYKVSDKFPNPFKNLDINDEKLLQVPNGKDIVIDYIDFITRDGLDDIDPYDKLKIINKEIKNQLLKEQIAAQEVRYSLLYTKKLEQYYQLFDSIVKDEALKTPIKEKYENYLALQPGALSPDFTAYDLNGKAYHLKDFAGKALYIDLWATWCSPCRAEIPFLTKIKEKYKDKPINFLSFDVYDSENKWKEFVQQNNMTGWQLINTDREMPFLKKYVVDGIPRFVLLDKEGKIVDANAPRPSNKSLIELIDKTIEK